MSGTSNCLIITCSAIPNDSEIHTKSRDSDPSLLCELGTIKIQVISTVKSIFSMFSYQKTKPSVTEFDDFIRVADMV
jgi:hypothetical protein